MGLLSWLRGARSGVSGTPAPDAAGAGAPTGPGHPAEGAWRELPPVQRTVTHPALITDPDGFRGSLSSWQDTTLSTPLGHLVSPQAPSGLVHGLAVPGGPLTGPTPAPASVSRQAEGSREGLVASWSSPPSAGGGTIVPGAVPLQRSGPAEAAMVSAHDPASGELPVRRLVGERPVEPSLPTSGPEPEAPSAPPAPSAPMAVRDSAPAPAPDAAPVQRSAVPEPATLPRPPKPVPTPGLGAPLAALPPTAQRQPAARLPGPTPDAPTGPLLGDVPPLVQREPEREPRQEPESRSEPRSERPARQTSGSYTPPGPLAPLPPVPVQRSVSATALPEAASGPVVPLIAQRAVPLFATGPDAPLAPLLSATAEPRPVPVRRPPPAEPAAVQRSYGAGPPPRQATVVRPPPQPAAQTHAPAPAALQRRVTGAPAGPPVPRSAPGAFRDAGSVAVAAGVAQRLADGSVVFGDPSVIQRETETTEPPPPDPPDPPTEVESVPEPEPEPGSDPGSEFPDARTDQGAAATAGPGGGPGGNAPPVTDELVRALYAPLSRLLKADLRLERERAGFLINTRH